VKGNFKNQNTRNLGSDTCHEFIEWVGLVNTDIAIETSIPLNTRLYKNELYYKFIDEYPDYGPRGKKNISRQEFYRWIKSYATYISGKEHEENRDHIGRWIIIREKRES
jgi:hypothetical protein